MAFALNRRRFDFSSTRTLFVKISHFYFLCRDGMSSQAMSSGAVDLSDGGHRQKKWSVMSGFEFPIRHNVNSHNGFPRTRRAKTRRRLERRAQPLWKTQQSKTRLKNICALLEVCDAVAFMQACLYKFGAFILMKLQNWVRSSLCSSTIWKIHVLAVFFCLSEQNNSHLFHKMNSENNLTCKPHQISSLNLLSDIQCPWHIWALVPHSLYH